MAITAESITQFSIPNEVASIREGATKEFTLNQLAHTFGEFATGIELADYHYIQTADNRLLAPGQEARGDVLNSFSRGINSPDSLLKYQSFVRLREKILEAREPTIAITFSPPGPKEEGFSDYAMFYFALIPQYQSGKERRIAMLAWRLNEFDQDTAEKTLTLIKMISGSIPMGKNLTERLLKSCVVIPLGERCEKTNPQEIFGLFSLALNRKIDQKLLKEGLAGRIIKGIYRTFRHKIYQLYTYLWQKANSFPTEINGERLFRAMDLRLMAGGCPSVPSSKQLDTSVNGKEEIHWCPVCGLWFSGNQCPCGYKLTGG